MASPAPTEGPVGKFPAVIPEREVERKTSIKSVSERIVRDCSSDCIFIKSCKPGNPKGCEYYQRGEVGYGQPCKYDLMMIDEFVQAHRNGDQAAIKDRIGTVMGGLMVKVYEMLDNITKDGITREEPILDGKGMPIMLKGGTIATRIVEHPLLARLSTMVKTIGFDLNKFKLTPETAQDNVKTVGNILLTTGDVHIHDLIDANRKLIERFEEGSKKAEEDLKNDPVFKQMGGDKQ